ncbi:hypothetical protein R3P38DRAFT_3232174 [Favolaschia claudopus]|uniref:Uncharacterized protein n=1 Tax=Favolaschia claudopus TaxID=2862362 RepID=A0AAV9ZJ83_9AGAR
MGPAPMQSFARMISPEYGSKIAQNTFTLAPPSRLQTEAYRMESKVTITIKYWAKDNQRPLTFLVPVPGFPRFHPKDCELMTSTLHLALATYAILKLDAPLETSSEEQDEWLITSIPTVVKPNSTLYMRSPEVTVCLGLRPDAAEPPMTPNPSPSSSAKRSASREPDPGTPSPAKRTRPGFSLRPREASSGEDDDDDVVLLSPQTLTPTKPKINASHPDSLVSPSGKHTPFPLPYACDMHAQFQKVEALPAAWTAKQKFDNVFGHLNVDFNSSTYSDSWNAWKRCPDNVLTSAVACEHRPGGEWGPIVTSYRKRSRT